MGRHTTGVHTVAGRLSFFLDDLDLTRRELADAVGVDVRTIHNIEHARKRVNRRTIATLAEVLNRFSAYRYPAAPPLLLNEHHFIDHPNSIVDVAMQSITSNRPDFLVNENPLIDPSLRWWINGDPERLGWTGLFDLSSLGGQIEEFYRCFEYLGVEGLRKFFAPREDLIVMRTDSNIRHPDTGVTLKYTSFIEFKMNRGLLQSMDATFNSELVTTFLESGHLPRRIAA